MRSAPREQAAKVNKVSTAIHLRFDLNASSLPASCKDAAAETEGQAHLQR